MHKVRIAILSGAVVLLGACGGPAEQAPSEPAVTASEPSVAATITPPATLPPAVAASQEPAATSSAAPTASPGVPAVAPSAKATAAVAAPSPNATAATAAVAVNRPAAFAMCASCHSVEPGRKGVGPSLHGVVGRTAGTQAGYNYSPAMKAFAKPWTAALLDTYLAKPSAVVPGTKMVVGVPDATRRKEVIEYLATLR